MITDISQLDLTKQYSYADYLTWKFQERVELFKGWVSKMAAPSPGHQQISFNINGIIYSYFKNHVCQAYPAPFDVRLPDSVTSTADIQIFTVVQPDFLCCL